MNDCKERTDFTERFWYYYKMLEEDCVGLQRYVRFCYENMGTSSDEIIKQFLAVSAEFDNICKEITGVDGDSSVSKYGDWFFSSYGFEEIENIVIVLRREKIEFRPFLGWREMHTMPWWTKHNHVKHERRDYYPEGSLFNLLNAIAALYFLECLQYKRIAENNPLKGEMNFDVPPDRSELFYLKNFKTEFGAFGYELIGKFE